MDQVSYFNKKVASKDMSGYYLLLNGEYAYNKSYSVGYDFGSIKRLDRYPMGALSTLYICFTLKKHDSDFIKAYFDSLKWYREIYMISAEGARNHGLLNVPTDEFFETKHYLPQNLNEQRKIADFIIALERRIDAQQSLVDNLKKYKRGLNHKLLSEIDEQYNRELGTVCSIVGGGTPDTLRPEYWEGNVEWFTPSEIGKSKYVLSSLRKISQVGLSNSSAKSLPSGTVLLTTRATLGEMSIARSECSTNQGFQSLVSDSKRVLPEYLYYLQILIKPWCEKYASGNTFREISKASLSKCVVPVPCLNSQKRIVCILSRIDELIETHERVEDSLTQIKEGLLQQLFI
ncbi:restriction endonuclease subunit S [Waltera sp.]|uniref:restriction endonuclease subunit S n=1 Tax=Waltera sp. TaxID=2815806 RepID=UPI003AB399E0